MTKLCPALACLLVLALPCAAQPAPAEPSGFLRAAMSGSVEDVARFLDGGADRRERTDQGKSALHLAAEFNPDPRVVSLLLGNLGETETRDDRGRTPLMAAAQRNTAPVVEVLLQAGADVQARDLAGHTAADLSSGNRKLVSTPTFWSLYWRQYPGRL